MSASSLSSLPLEPSLVQRLEAKGIRTTESLFQLGVRGVPSNST